MPGKKPLKIGETIPIRTFETGDYIPAEHGGVPIGGTAGQVLAKVDATDHNTAWATPSGGGGGSIVEKTHAEMVTLIAATDLTVGQHYNITDAAGTDLGVIVLATTDATLSIQGIGGYSSGWVPVEYDFDNDLIIYRSDLAGNVVRGNTGVASFPFGVAAYLNNILEAGASVSGMTLGADCSIARNNLKPAATFSNIAVGDTSNINDNTLGASAVLSEIDIVGRVNINGNNLGYAAQITECDAAGNANINTNELSINGLIGYNIFGSGATLSSNSIGINAAMREITLGGGSNATLNVLGVFSTIDIITTGPDCSIERNILENAGRIGEITMGEGCIVYANKIGQNARFQTITMGDYSQLAFNILLNEVNVSNKTIDSGVLFNNNTIGINMTDVETISANIVGKRIIPGYSDAEITVDITGLTTLAIPVNYAGIINITSTNATETISTISGFPTDFPFQLRPESGLTLTVTGTAIGGIGANQVALTTASVAINGTKKEWVELKSSGSGWTLETNRLIGIV